MTTPTPATEAIEALSDHGMTGCAVPERHSMCLAAAQRKYDALTAAGWTLARSVPTRPEPLTVERLAAAIAALPKTSIRDGSSTGRMVVDWADLSDILAALGTSEGEAS